MSYELESTLQHQMGAPSKARFQGWLTMAPEVDTLPTAAAASLSSVNSKPATLDHDTWAPASTHGFGMFGKTARLPQRKKQRATFQVGSPDLTDDETEGQGSRSSGSSSRLSRSSSDVPDFDVRASFAPMPAYGKSKAPSKASDHAREQDAEQNSGLTFAGRKWKGKTVHAVEQELEALRDERLLSHAPDPNYLASRLEGLRRNLEIEERKPRYVEYEEDYLTDGDDLPLRHPYQRRGDADLALKMGIEAMPALAHRPVSNASSVSLVEGETPHDFDFGMQFDATSHPAAPVAGAYVDDVRIHNIDDDDAFHESSVLTIDNKGKQIDPAVRAAALDSRIDIRALRRSDLEQVRDLHAFHGESDRSPVHTDTYATTASFLLRLLVDDRHVCLVAVAKPIPEPAAPLPGAVDLSSLRGHSQQTRDGRSPSEPASPADSPASAPTDDVEAMRLSPPHTLPAAIADVSAAAAAEADSAIPSCSTSPSDSRTPTSSLFSASLPPAAHRLMGPRGPDGRINNTPATSVFSDILAERGLPRVKTIQDELPGPTEELSHAPVKKVMAVPPPRGVEVETETIVGVVSARLTAVTAPTGDTLWEKPQDQVEEAAALIDIHLLTLSISPEERGQGLGSKLLSALHGECMIKSRHMAMKLRSRPTCPLPTIPALTPKFIDLEERPHPPHHHHDGGSSDSSSEDHAPFEEVPRQGKYLARTFLEVHPSNQSALALYTAHGFRKPREESKAVKKGFYRGDTRISTAERAKRGGTDAWVLQRFDGFLAQ